MEKMKRRNCRIANLIFIILSLIILLLLNHQSPAQTAREPVVTGVPCCGASIPQVKGIVTGVTIKKVEPIYPDKARRKKISGAVVVEVLIDEAGNVKSARALTGPKLLKESAATAARDWKFEPTLLDGRPVKVIGTITFNFNLADTKSENRKEN